MYPSASLVARRDGSRGCHLARPSGMASMIFGPPSRITSMAQFGETGVDEQAAIILGYDQGRLATLYTSLRTDTPREAILLGAKGRIRIHPLMFRPTKLTLSLLGSRRAKTARSRRRTETTGEEDNIIEMPLEGNGYNYEAAEVMRCLQAGKLESDTMPLDETLAIMKTMDQIRAQCGLKYPMEAPPFIPPIGGERGGRTTKN